VPPNLKEVLDELALAANQNDSERTIALLLQMLPDYVPSKHMVTPASVGAPYPDGL
jgi:hypothetical protein